MNRFVILTAITAIFVPVVGFADPEEGEKAPNKIRIFKEQLCEEYEVWYVRDRDELTTILSWEVRFGLKVYTAKLANLDFAKAEIEDIERGAFSDMTIVRIPTKKPGQVSVRSWDSHPDGEIVGPPDHLATQDHVFFHCKGDGLAKVALEMLKKLK